MRREFEAQWPALAVRIERLLARKGVPSERRDDLLQETALRLIGMWPKIDPHRIEGLATTIALNLLRDELRKRKSPDVVAQIPDLPEPCDVEAAGLARVELGRVRVAMASLSPRHRSALLREIGDGDLSGLNQDAEKMMRMRARKKLQAALQRVSGLLVFKVRRIADSLNGFFFGGREALLQGFACVGCVAIGLMVAAPNVSLVRPAHAAPAPQTGLGERAFGKAATMSHAGTQAPARRLHGWLSEAKKPAKNEIAVPGGGKISDKDKLRPGTPVTGKNPKDKTPPSKTLPVDPPDTGINPDDLPVPDAPDAPDAPDVPELPNPAPAPLPEPPNGIVDPVGAVEGMVDDVEVAVPGE